MRPIVVDGERYLWRRTHRHTPGCVEALTVVVPRDAAHGGARLSLRFSQHEGWTAGGFSAGVLECPGQLAVNLNRPAVVAALVRRARDHGWPSERRLLEIRDAYEWLEDVPRGV